MLNQYINEFKMIKVSYAMAGTDPSSELNAFFNKVYDEIKDENHRKQLVAAVENPLDATYMFFEMFLRKIGNDLPIWLTYYFATLTTTDSSLSQRQREMGNMYRAFIMVKGAERLNFFLSMISDSGFMLYRGHLTGAKFKDIAILSDVYKAWNADPDSRYLQFLKNQAPSIASIYPLMSKTDIEKEGELAHKAISQVISMKCC